MTTVKELRQAKGVTQKDIAKLMNVAQSTVCMWERGKAKPPIDKIVRLAGILSVPVDDLAYIFTHSEEE